MLSEPGFFSVDLDIPVGDAPVRYPFFDTFRYSCMKHTKIGKLRVGSTYGTTTGMTHQFTHTFQPNTTRRNSQVWEHFWIPLPSALNDTAATSAFHPEGAVFDFKDDSSAVPSSMRIWSVFSCYKYMLPGPQWARIYRSPSRVSCMPLLHCSRNITAMRHHAPSAARVHIIACIQSKPVVIVRI